jgi:hypothetical protein
VSYFDARTTVSNAPTTRIRSSRILPFWATTPEQCDRARINRGQTWLNRSAGSSFITGKVFEVDGGLQSAKLEFGLPDSKGEFSHESRVSTSGTPAGR